MKKMQILGMLLFAVLFSFSIQSCDDEEDCTKSSWYADTDGDGFGDASNEMSECEQPTGFVSNSTDVNDNDASITTEFVATNSTFAGFESWILEATESGLNDALDTGDPVTQAHAGHNPDVTRRIYFKDGADRVGDTYPVGTVIGKSMLSSDGAVAGYFGMAKREPGYSVLGDWEWFLLNADGSVKDDADGNPERGGADFKACGGCHAGASATDYTFTK